MCDVGDVVCWGCGMWYVRDVRCLRCGMFEMWNVRNVGCSECRMWEVGYLQGCGVLTYKMLIVTVLIAPAVQHLLSFGKRVKRDFRI